jgi:RNA ligase (TIGR02306 family)
MSTIHIEAVEIAAINPHPNADKLEIATILGTECCVQKGKHKVGETVVWFPPNMLIPTSVGEALGVTQYLKRSCYATDAAATNCRVAATRLRSVPSFGFIISLAEAKAAAKSPAPLLEGHPLVTFGDDTKPGMNLDGYFGGIKYEPPAAGAPGTPRAKGFNADAAPDHPDFHKYTDIENHYRYENMIPEGEPVRITEKLHGRNIRLGLINVDGQFEFMVGSHKVNWKPEDSHGNVPLWWQMLTEPVVNLLTALCEEQNNVIVFGEIYGPGVQDMDYGEAEPSLRVFDISVNRRYLNWCEVEEMCFFHGVETVPLLYKGPYSKAVLKEHTYGLTKVAEAEAIRSKFKDREGCVVTPLNEQIKHGSRVILKSVSADYLGRKGGQDH